MIRIKGNRGDVKVQVPVVKASAQQKRQARGRFASLDGPLAILAADAPVKKSANGASWQTLPDYGREKTALEVFPVTTASVLPPNPAPQLEYPVYLPRSGDYEITLVLGPVMDIVPDRGMRIAIGLNDEPLQVLDIFADRQAETFLSDSWWYRFTRDNARYLKSTHKIKTAGPHLLNIAMVDPAIVLQKIIISDKPVPKSYFGPITRNLYQY